jgi:hypothetical protein
VSEAVAKEELHPKLKTRDPCLALLPVHQAALKLIDRLPRCP